MNLKDLRKANATRSAVWPGAENINVEFAAIELAGEVGELMNAIKKRIRHMDGIKGNKEDFIDILTNIEDELGDVIISADLLAMKLGIDLSSVVVSKFNKTSNKHGFKVFLENE